MCSLVALLKDFFFGLERPDDFIVSGSVVFLFKSWSVEDDKLKGSSVLTFGQECVLPCLYFPQGPPGRGRLFTGWNSSLALFKLWVIIWRVGASVRAK